MIILWLAGALPYARWLRHDAANCGITGIWPPSRAQAAIVHALGSAAFDGVTLLGLLSGSLAWRCLVL